jgi:hypothetical protein
MTRRLVMALLVAASASASADTRVELYTMGPGDDLFSAFGHAALCVADGPAPGGVCYNYGVTDFADPAAVVWSFLRARPRYWVSRMPLPLMLESFAAQDRTIYRQVLALPAAAADVLAARLAYDAQPAHKYYRYNHYRDNCSTRLRDEINDASGGLLRPAEAVPYGKTWRDPTLLGFASDLRLLIGAELLVGRPVDEPMTVWDAMFLPDVLRTEVAKRLGARIEVVHARAAPLGHDDPLAGRRVLFGVAGGLTLLLALAALLGRRGPWHFLLGVAGLVLGLAGLAAAALAVVALMPELRRNEVVLVCLPTDVLLAVLRGRALVAYLAARLALLAAVVAGLLGGALIQPMWAAVALAAGPLVVATVREAVWVKRLPRDRSSAEDAARLLDSP